MASHSPCTGTARLTRLCHDERVTTSAPALSHFGIPRYASTPPFAALTRIPHSRPFLSSRHPTVYIPAVLYAVHVFYDTPTAALYAAAGRTTPPAAIRRAGRTLALAALLFNPSLLLIDHGHFQYNGISLGCTLAGRDFPHHFPHHHFR